MDEDPPSPTAREVPCIIVAAVYNPPKSRAEKRLLERITHTVTVLKNKYLNCGFMICGDFNNADISSIHDSELVNVVGQPTRGNNTLDLIICNLRRFYQNTTILPPIGRSDHFTVVWKPSVQTPKPTNEANTPLATHYRLRYSIIWAMDYILQLEARP